MSERTSFALGLQGRAADALGRIQDKVPNSKRGHHRIYLDLITAPCALAATPEKGSAAFEAEREKLVCQKTTVVDTCRLVSLYVAAAHRYHSGTSD